MFIQINPNTHIFLYAKHWYKENDIEEDLKVIVGNAYYLEPRLLSTIDIAKALVKITIEQILHSDTGNKSDKEEISGKFSELIWDIHPHNRWVVGGNEEESFELSVIRKCLSILRLISVKDIKNLGIADPNLLPLKNKDLLNRNING